MLVVHVRHQHELALSLPSTPGLPPIFTIVTLDPYVQACTGTQDNTVLHSVRVGQHLVAARCQVPFAVPCCSLAFICSLRMLLAFCQGARPALQLLCTAAPPLTIDV